MAKLTKAEAKKHAEAEALIERGHLTEDDKDFILEHWQESATNVNSAAGAFFTPIDLARDLSLEAGFHHGKVRIIDLCAGIGTLSLAIRRRLDWSMRDGSLELELVCVEMNPEYVRLGREMVPDAEWVQASIFDLPDLGRFDLAVSNPPFGKVKRDGDAPRYKGAEFEYHVIDIAAHVAEMGAFIIPNQSASFRYSGEPRYHEESNQKHDRFVKQTGIRLEAGVGVDTSIYENDWHGVSPRVEIVTAEFEPTLRLPDVRDNSYQAVAASLFELGDEQT